KLRYKGHACVKCGYCRDWYWRLGTYEKVYTKRTDAECGGYGIDYRGCYGCGDGHFHRHYHHRYLDNSRADDYIYYCFFPQLVNMEQAYRSSNHTNLQIAFDTAQPHYGIAKLIDSEDVDNDNPDEKSIFLYISHLYKICPSITEHPFQ
ncbi:unnamed protein product, partial [Didymodactylos carnosus]